MNDLMRYSSGFAIGMCLEYLYRVEYSVFALLIILCNVLIFTIDINKTKN